MLMLMLMLMPVEVMEDVALVEEDTEATEAKEKQNQLLMLMLKLRPMLTPMLRLRLAEGMGDVVMADMEVVAMGEEVMEATEAKEKLKLLPMLRLRLMPTMAYIHLSSPAMHMPLHSLDTQTTI